jgi:hypothetical protein
MVCDRTEGWPVGIQLAGLSPVSESDRSESIESFARLVVSETDRRLWAAQASDRSWWRRWKSIPPSPEEAISNAHGHLTLERSSRHGISKSVGRTWRRIGPIANST